MNGIAALLLALLCPVAHAAAALRAGFASIDVTPAAGAQMPGSFRAHLATGVRDPLEATAAVVTDGTTTVALVGLDALFTPKPVADAARAAIERSTGILGRNVLIGASHTHSGGPIVSCLGSEADPAYVATVGARIAEAVGAAHRRLEAVELGIGRDREGTIAFNRRFLMKDGREITHPGKPGTPYHGDIVRPAGPIDPDVGVLAARRADGALTGVVVHFTCHATVVGGDLFSADYVGALRRQLRARHGGALPVVFLQGACGDVTQVDNLAPGRESGPEHAETMGRKLADAADRALGALAWSGDLPVAATTESVPVRLRDEPDLERERPAFGLGSGQEEVYARERRLVAEERARTPVHPCEVMGVRIGPLGIATNGAEYFCDYGLRIKQGSPFGFTWFVGYANEYIGYVPTAQAFAAGGYEPRTARSSKLAVDAGQRLLEGALRALAALAGP